MPDDSPHGPRSDAPSAPDEESGPIRRGAPVERTFIGRIFVFGGPLGLLAALLIGLWVAGLHVRHSVVVQVDETWVPGRRVAMRSQLLDRDLHGIEGVEVAVRVVDAAGTEWPLGALEPVPRSGVSQGRFVVPELALGPAQVVLRYVAPAITSFEEAVPIMVAEQWAPRDPAHVVSGSTLNWADDTGPQPPGLRIVVRSHGRLLAGFRNRVLVRVTDPDGQPLQVPLDLRLVDGEFMGFRGDPDDPPRLRLSTTDSLGLLELAGPLASEVLRLEVRVLDREAMAEVRRLFRFVSFAGAVRVTARPTAVAAGDATQIRAWGLSAKRPVFVDVFDDDGAWVDTISPPFVGGEPARPWVPERDGPGLVQLEAYHFTNNPGESTAVARVQVTDAPPSDPRSLAPLIAMQRARLGVPRVERDFDEVLERKYLDHLETLLQQPGTAASARSWLLGTLPIAVYGPPTALNTRPREDAALAARKLAWRLGLRWFLLGGGGLFLLVLSVVMVRAHGQAARVTLEELQRSADAEDEDVVREHVRQAQRAAMTRGIAVIAVMAAGLVLTLMMLENLL